MLRQKQLRQLIAVQRLVRHMATQRRLLVGQAGNFSNPGRRYLGKSANLVKTLNTGNPKIKGCELLLGQGSLTCKGFQEVFLGQFLSFQDALEWFSASYEPKN